jgi:hypothetical protein
MKNVFNGNTAFDQDISDWDTTNVSTENLAGFATGAIGLTASEVPSSVPSDSVEADPPPATDTSDSSAPADDSSTDTPPSAPQSGDQSSTSIDFSNGSWEQVGDDINGEYAGDLSGRAVSLNSDGTIVAIGAYKNSGYGFETGSDDGTYTWAGHVRIFENDNGTWTQMGSEINGQAEYELLGISVSLNSDGTIVAIGGYSSSISTDPGKVRVYEYDSGTEDWDQVGDDIDSTINNDQTGYSVSLNSDGTIVAFGKPGVNYGSFAVYENVNGTWTQLGDDITYADNSGGSSIGKSVSLNSDGTIVAVGAPGNDDNGVNAGHARVYEYNSGTEDWDQVGDDIDGEAAGDSSGTSVSLSSDGTIVAVGAYGNDDNGNNSGHVRVYENVNDTWTQIGDDIDGEAAGDSSGFSVSLNSDGTVLAVGAYLNDGDGTTDSGHVRVYENDNGTWTQIDTDIDGDEASDYSGVATALSSDGTIVAVGAFYDDWTQVSTYYSQDIDDAGVTRVYEFNES